MSDSGDDEIDIFPLLVQKLYEIELFWDEQITGLERQLANATANRDSVSETLDELEKGATIE